MTSTAVGSRLQPTPIDVPVAGGLLRVARYGTGAVPVLGLHGVTASSASFRPVVRRLAERFTLYAPDLRGRGGSASLPGPYGFRAHADDAAAVIRELGLGPVLVVGESMGAYVATVLASAYPDLVRALLLVDGGLPLELPVGVDPAAAVAAALGPALERLAREFPSRAAYREYWQAHPAFRREWNEDIEAYLDYDLTGTEPALRSRVAAAAVEEDTAVHLLHPSVVTDALASLRCPVALLRAPRGLLDQEVPLLPDAVVETWRARLPQLQVELVPDTNHYTLMFGERGAARIAALVEELSAG